MNPQAGDLTALPPQVAAELQQLVSAAQASFCDDLISIILYGSAAEGRLRATSDVNLLFILRRFSPQGIDPFREPLRNAYAAVNARVMFVLEDELCDAVEEFAVKFDDIARRRVVLYGSDPLAAMTVSREATIRRLRQMLLNMTIRLRERYAIVSLREEQLPLVIADFAGSLRAAATSILELQGKPAPSPKEALARLVGQLGDGSRFSDLLMQISNARETRTLPVGTARPALLAMIDLTARLHEIVHSLEQGQ